MCNAHNHPPGCTCGWGGEGHLGSSSGFIQSLRPLYESRHSYVNPNATCPVCNAGVFFYSSPHGGRVYFDELGPPWPKHPCTDLGRFIPISVDPDAKPKVFQWQLAGWEPLIIASVASYTQKLIRVSGEYKASQLLLYLRKQDLHFGSELVATIDASLAHLRPTESGRYALSLLAGGQHIVDVCAYSSSFEASGQSSFRRRKP